MLLNLGIMKHLKRLGIIIKLVDIEILILEVTNLLGNYTITKKFYAIVLPMFQDTDLSNIKSLKKGSLHIQQCKLVRGWNYTSCLICDDLTAIIFASLFSYSRVKTKMIWWPWIYESCAFKDQESDR